MVDFKKQNEGRQEMKTPNATKANATEVLRCSKCNWVLQDGATECSSCGHKIHLSDEVNPEMMFQTIDKKLLVAAIKGEIDLYALVKQELANRGYDDEGNVVGWANRPNPSPQRVVVEIDGQSISYQLNRNSYGTRRTNRKPHTCPTCKKEIVEYLGLEIVVERDTNYKYVQWYRSVDRHCFVCKAARARLLNF